MATTYECLRIERSEQGWASIALHRPDKLNTLSVALRQELDQAVEALEQDPGVHVLILTGTGKAFTAGLDLDGWNSPEGPAAGAYRWDAVASLRKFTGPVIAAVNGLCITGGVEIVLACDLIVASDRARFADTHVCVGLLPGWGGSPRMIERVGIHRAKELALTGRMFSAQEAAAWGFVNEVVPHDDLLPRAQALAAEMLQARPQDLAQYKQLLDEESRLPFGEALRHERARSMAVNSPVTLDEIQSRLRQLVRKPPRD
jgi:enoyl-CoA hydratase